MIFPKTPVLITAGVLLAQLAFGSVAFAEPGDALHSDEGWKLSPSLRLAATYNSNVYRASSDETASTVADAPILGIEPAIAIQSPRERMFLLDLDAGLSWDQYFSVDDSTSFDVGDQSGLNAFGNLNATINPEGALSLRIDENISRQNEPSPYTSGESYNWFTNDLGGVVGIRPGAGVLSFDLGYHWKIYAFDNEALESLDRDVHRFDLDINWKFLPKTSLVAMADYRLVRWNQQTRLATRDDGSFPELRNNDNNPLRVQGGLTGLLTERVSVQALAGYGASMHDQGESFSGVIGSLALAYAFGRLDLNNRLGVGYRRDFGEASVGNFFTSHQVYAGYEQNVLDKRLSFNLGGRFEYRDYSTTGSTFGTDLDDQLLVGNAGVGVNATDWLNFGLDYQLSTNLTDNGYVIDAVDPTDPSISVLRGYTQHLATLSMTAKY